MKRSFTSIAIAALFMLSSAATTNAQNHSYDFGMNVTLQSFGNQKGLAVVSVVPGGAAARAGLFYGDVITKANHLDFNSAFNDYQGLAILQTAAASSVNSGIPTAVSSARAIVHLVVYRNGRCIHLCVYPVCRPGWTPPPNPWPVPTPNPWPVPTPNPWPIAPPTWPTYPPPCVKPPCQGNPGVPAQFGG